MAIKYNMLLESLHKNLDIWKSWIDIPADLKSKIYDLKKTDSGAKKSNCGGWQSTSFLVQSEDYNWITGILQDIELEVKNKKFKIMNCWFNVNSKGNYNNWHNHGHRPYVGVIYIEVPKNSGEISFCKNQEIFSYQPKIGDFLVFPGNLEHQVSENKANEDRISMAINFYF